MHGHAPDIPDVRSGHIVFSVHLGRWQERAKSSRISGVEHIGCPFYECLAFFVRHVERIIRFAAYLALRIHG